MLQKKYKIGKVLFQGEGEFEQINEIFGLLGTPNDDIWKGYSELPHAKKFKWKYSKPKLKHKFPTNKPLTVNTGDIAPPIHHKQTNQITQNSFNGSHSPKPNVISNKIKKCCVLFFFAFFYVFSVCVCVCMCV